MDHWKKANSVAMVITERDLGHKKTRETRYFLSSLKADSKGILSAVRQHWGIESAPQAHKEVTQEVLRTV